MSVSDDAKLLFVFVLTHPHMTSTGALRNSISGLATELGWTRKRATKAFEQLLNKPLLEYDDRIGPVIVAPNFVKHNQPENPNVVKGWRSSFNDLPECELVKNHYERVKGFLKGFPQSFRKPFEKPFAEPFRNQEQEQEQEQDLYEESYSDSPSEDTEDVFDKAPCAGGQTYLLREAKVLEYETLYGEQIDVRFELHKACQWLRDNPSRRKTVRGMPKYLNGWLSRAVDSARGKRPTAPPKLETLDDDDIGGIIGTRLVTPEEADAALGIKRDKSGRVVNDDEYSEILGGIDVSDQQSSGPQA